MNEKIIMTAVIVWVVLFILIRLLGDPFSWKATPIECWLIPAIWIDSILIVVMSLVVVWS